MDELTVRNVDVLGDTIVAGQDKEGQIWAGVSFFCKALGMTNKQRDNQVVKVQTDKTLSKGTLKFREGVFDPANEVVAIKVDFIPLWLAKIQITKKMEQDHPDLADKLLEYQLKAKDILAAAFLPKQNDFPRTTQAQIRLLAQGNVELNQRVDGLEKETLYNKEEIQSVKEELNEFKEALPLLPEDADEISNLIKKRGVEILGGKQSPAYNDQSLRMKLYRNFYSNLKYNFGGVSTYKAIKRNQKADALRVIAEYKPPLFLQEQIDNVNAQQTLDI